MTKLQWDFKRLCDRDRRDSFATRGDRKRMLSGIARDLNQLGFRNLRAEGLKPKHVEALFRYWQGAENHGETRVSTATLKNRAAAIRWWADAIGKSNVVPRTNSELGLGRRTYAPTAPKAVALTQAHLDAIRYPEIAASLRLQASFGLRREEAIKIHPIQADRGSHLVLKGSWCKGGRPRVIPIITSEQRDALNHAKTIVRDVTQNGSLIPRESNYRQHGYLWRRETERAGISRTHSLRHHYAITRYQTLTGRVAPIMGGPSISSLSDEEARRDLQARKELAEELGHSRHNIVTQYVGR